MNFQKSPSPPRLAPPPCWKIMATPLPLANGGEEGTPHPLGQIGLTKDDFDPICPWRLLILHTWCPYLLRTGAEQQLLSFLTNTRKEGGIQGYLLQMNGRALGEIQSRSRSCQGYTNDGKWQCQVVVGYIKYTEPPGGGGGGGVLTPNFGRYVPRQSEK